MIKHNPAPAVDTNYSFFLKHFMILLSEENMPVTSIISYVKELGFHNTDLFIDVMMTLYGHYRSEMNKQQRKETDGRKKL